MSEGFSPQYQESTRISSKCSSKKEKAEDSTSNCLKLMPYRNLPSDNLDNPYNVAKADI